MLKKLGNTIEKRPWLVVTAVIIVTIGFSTFIPSLEFKTDFNEFTPDDELVKAHERIFGNFGAITSQQIMLIHVEKQQAENTITPQAIKELYFIQKELEKIPKVNGTLAITTFIDTVCLVEFGKNLENCTDEQIQVALQDVLREAETGEIQILKSVDPNEPVDYKRYPRISKGKSFDSADIKNCYIFNDDDTITFSIEVYDLSDFQSALRPSFPWVNVMEWYIDFENLIGFGGPVDIDYKIAAHIEPKNQVWEIGKGFFKNIREFFQNIRNRELLNSYEKDVYLWIKPSGQTMYFPLPLETGDILFDTNRNRINIVVSREELGDFGIAPRFDLIELPAKLSNFSVGVRYYQTPLLRLPGGRVGVNTSFLFKRFERLQTRPVLSAIASRMLQRFGGITWEDFEEIFEMMGQTEVAQDSIALKDIESSWIQSDVAPNTGFSDTVFLIYPRLFEDIRVNALSFLSKDYEQTNSPRASLIILYMDFGEDYEETLGINREVLGRLSEIDEEFNYVSVQATGEGVINSEINEVTSESNQLIGPSIFIIIMIILFISFRRASYVILPMLALGISAIWLFGTMAFLGIAFNVIAVALVPLIMGLGVDYSVHIFHNYRAELQKDKTPGHAIKTSVRDVGKAMFLAMITTVIAFLSFLSANMEPIRNFGILLALGITYTFITAITLLAASRYIIDRRKKIKVKNKRKTITLGKAMGKLSQVVLCHQKKILIIMLIISLVMASGAIRLEKGFDIDQFIPKDNPSLQLYEKISEDFPYSSQDQEYILIEGNVATVKTLEGIAKTHENLEDNIYVSHNTDGSVKATSIYTVIQQAIRNNESLITAFNIDERTGIPKTDGDVYSLFEYLYSGNDFDTDELAADQFILEDFNGMETKSVLYRNNSIYESTLIRVYIDSSFVGKEGNLNDDLEALKKELNDDIETYGDATAMVTGLFIIQYTITDSLTDNQIITTGVSLVLAAFVIILAYRNPILGLITMIPIGISIVWILGTMFYLGFILNVMTVTVTCITIGIGIDYAIHATERFRLVADRTGDVTKAVCETISHTGGALLIAALTTALGFGILILAPIPPQQQFGVIIAVTIIYSLLTSVLILPLILVRWARWRKKRKGYIISPQKYKVDEKDNLPPHED